MKKKKKSLRDRIIGFQVRPLKILAKEVTEGIKEGLKDKDEKEKH